MGFVLLKKRRLKKVEFSFNLGKKKEVLRLAKPLLNSKNTEFSSCANRLTGLTLYKQKKYEDSLQFLKTACQLKNYRHDWYNLTMSLAYNGNFKEAEEAFKNIYRTNVQPGYMYAAPVPLLIFQYLRALKQKGNTQGAITKANELKQMYAGVGLSDTNKQVQRGLPAYPTFKKEIEPLFQLQKLNDWEEKLR